MGFLTFHKKHWIFLGIFVALAVMFVIGYAYMVEHQSKKFTEQMRQQFIPIEFQGPESDSNEFIDQESFYDLSAPQKEWPRRQESCATCEEFKKESLSIHSEHKNSN